MNKMLRLNALMVCLSAVMLLSPLKGIAQITGRLDVEFIVNGINLANPLTGGINAPQLSEVDLDDDGIMDLYIFDRIGNRHLTFLNSGATTGNIYTYAPEYEINFPPINGWLLLRDYNGDGIMDIFAYSDQIVSGVIVFRGQ